MFRKRFRTWFRRRFRISARFLYGTLGLELVDIAVHTLKERERRGGFTTLHLVMMCAAAAAAAPKAEMLI